MSLTRAGRYVFDKVRYACEWVVAGGGSDHGGGGDSDGDGGTA